MDSLEAYRIVVMIVRLTMISTALKMIVRVK